MDQNLNAKLFLKKSQLTMEKLKKSAGKKKKKSKKTSSKCDQSPDNLEVEGHRKFEPTGADSDSSLARPVNSASPTVSNPSSSTCLVNNDAQEKTRLSKPKSSKSAPDKSSYSGFLKPTHSASVLSYSERDANSKRISVSFPNFNEIQSVSTSLSNMSVKSKNGSSKSKTKLSSKSGSNGATARKDRTAVKIDTAKIAANKAAEEAARLRSEESLRWEFALEDEEQERERIKIYKINRRKRYLAAAQAKGLGWVVNYGNNGFPLVDESVTDIRDREPLHTTITDFSPVRSIMASQSNGPVNLAGEMAC